MDKECHAIPIIEKTVESNSFLLPSIIIAVAILIGSVLLYLRKQDSKAMEERYNRHYKQWYESQVGKVPEEETDNMGEIEKNDPHA